MAESRIRARLEALKTALQAGARPAEAILAAQLEEQLKLERRLEKITRISDGYQAQLQDLNHRLQASNEALTKALAEVKTLRGFIPICAKCKRIRDDEGFWEQVDSYVSRHSEVVFSHGVCPDCAHDLFGTKLPAEGTRIRPRSWRPREEDESMLLRIGELLASAEHQGHPLHEELARLSERYVRLHSRFMKITRISDSFQGELKSLNLSLADISLTDPMTGLRNRRGILEALQAEIVRTTRAGGSFAVLMADVDQFKRINDTYGHDAGDRVLESLGGNLRAAIRACDLCARWGGEEFLMLLPGADEAAALAVAEKLRTLLAAQPARYEKHTIPTTLSMGVSVWLPGEDLRNLLRRTDAALYAAKAQGRDRVVAAATTDGQP